MMDTVKDAYQEHGSIEPPRIIGRIVRLLLGVVCLDLVRQIVDDIPGMIERGWPVNLVAICTVFLGLYLLRPVLNLGFTLKNNYWAQILVFATTLAILIYEWLSGGPMFGRVFTAFLMLWMTYVFGHLGISFVLSAIIKTPGCEMRAIPHLWTIVTGKQSFEHHCPGFIRNIDEWEQNRKK
ncbi:MAG: hypothetical protein OQJ89_13555 [Kangiellaceae bacterium]|nr:hypothetical protein [Kangiellaceae bacterium]MCW9017991.1 hypothetical protein [Kangiellaceae bacterium]